MPPVRDKRYLHPVLWFDLFEGDIEVPIWTKSGFILDGMAHALTIEDRFTGMLSFETSPKQFGLFEATVSTRDTTLGKVRVDFTWVSGYGQTLLEQMSVRKDERGRPVNALRFSRGRRSINWSFSGALLEYTAETANPGDRLRAMIRLEKVTEQVYLRIGVIRRLTERKALAIKFSELSPEAFELLEMAIKKAG